MSAIHPYAWRNGELIAANAICLSPFQAGLLTGWGLFSTLRIYQGVPFALEDHWQRLGLDGERLRISLDGLEPDMRRGFAALIEHNRAAEAVARIYLVRNHGGLLDQPGPRATDLLMFTRDLRHWGASAKLRLQPHGRHAQAPLAGAKSLSWAHNLVLVEEANAAGFDDVLLLNERGEVAECTAANVFVVRHGVLKTPPLSSGALPGVSRKILLDAGPRHGLEIEEATLMPEDLFTADEVLITSSTREVQPVAAIDSHSIPLGAFAERVADLFRRQVAAYLAAHPAASPAQPGRQGA